MSEGTIPDETLDAIIKRTSEKLIGWEADISGELIWTADIEGYNLYFDASRDPNRLSVNMSLDGERHHATTEGTAKTFMLRKLLMDQVPRWPTRLEKAMKNFDDILNRL